MSVTVKRLLIAVVICAVFMGTYCDDDVDLTFPSGFRLGAASSSYQIEGGWNASDKGENNWDHCTHYRRDAIADHRDGDVACDSYYKYKEDVALIKSIGLDFYRFSISWSRVLPTGFTNKISKDGLQYYKNLTAELVANGIEPIVTIYHWDHPQPIEEMGGWTNEQIVDWFVDYARVVFEALGDSVKRWTTINDPHSVCDALTKSLDEQTKRIWYYLCGHNVLKAHAKTYRMYDAEFRATQKGQIGIVLAMPAFLSANPSDTESAETAFQFNAGWMAHPIYKGDYPEIMKKRFVIFSAYQGYAKSLLPVFSEEWISIINGTADYFAFNHYTSLLVAPHPDKQKGIHKTENGLIATFDPSWPSTISPWMKVNPPGFGYLIRKIRDEYGNPPVWVMGNGYPDAGELKDYNRISYYHGYMREMLIAIKQGGCNVQGYAAWSILDNFEWNVGYTVKFGIVSVDFNDPNRTRNAKLSTSWWKSIVASRQLQPVPEDQTFSEFVTTEIVTEIDESDHHYPSEYTLILQWSDLTAVFIFTVFRVTSCCDVVSLTFPSGFRIGTASSSYQVEGAWNASDKGENVWDHWVHESTDFVADGSSGDIACNSYYKYKEDVAWIKSLGLDFYRFSISWSRVLPTGFANVVSEDGIQYYKNLTAELIANGIEPIVTMYHGDHPQIIEEMGGWTNELIVDWFVAYARVVFRELGDNVKRWSTINEPDSVCDVGYEITEGPGIGLTGMGRYLCGHNILKAHAKTYRMYDEEFRASQQGQIGIVIPITAYLPVNSSDTESEETAFQFNAGWMAHPIYKGDYPEILKTRVALVSEYQGYPRSRLPEFSDEWIAIINGTADYFAVNHYTTKLVSPDPDEELGIYNTDKGLLTSVDESWPVTGSGDSHVYPPGFGYVLRRIRDEYGNPPVWILENGYPDVGESEDYDRISYYYDYVREMLIAIKRDGCNVEGYSAWSIVDNFEWGAGYTVKFGLVSVDFDDPDRTRSAKLSTHWWKSVATSRRLQSVPTNLNLQKMTLPWNR